MRTEPGLVLSGGRALERRYTSLRPQGCTLQALPVIHVDFVKLGCD